MHCLTSLVVVGAFHCLPVPLATTAEQTPTAQHECNVINRGQDLTDTTGRSKFTQKQSAHNYAFVFSTAVTKHNSSSSACM